jgi:hypothetical protein
MSALLNSAFYTGVKYAAELRFTFGGDQLQGFWLTGNSVNHPLPLTPASKGICTF